MRPAFLTAAIVAGLGLVSPAFADTAKTVEAFTTLPITQAAQDTFLPVMEKNVASSRTQPGNNSFDAFVSEDGKPGVYVFERWADQASIDTHLKTPALAAVNEVAPKSLGGTPTTYWLQEVPQIPPTPVKDVRAPRNVITIFTTKDDTRDAFIKLMADLTPKARDADGNEGYNLYQVKDHPDEFMLMERWDSTKQHYAHLTAEYSSDFNKAADPLLASNPMDTRWVLVQPKDEK